MKGTIRTNVAVLGIAAAVLLLQSACGQLDQLKKQAKSATANSDEEGSSDDTPPGPTEPVTVDQDVDRWSDDAISALNLPAQGADTATPYDSCSAYSDHIMTYAKALQAIYLKRFIAWGRYHLAMGTIGPKVVVIHDTDYPGYPDFDGPVSSSDGKESGADTLEGAESPGNAADDAAVGSAGAATTSAPNTTPSTTNTVAAEYQTNNQEQGVDETDYVKSNGTHVFVAHGNLLRVFDLKGQVVHAAQIVGENPRGLHLAGDKLVLVTEASVPYAYATPQITIPATDPAYWWEYYVWNRGRLFYYQQQVRVREFTIAASGVLAQANERRYFGNFRDGREINGELHLVIQKNLPWHILQTGLAFNLHPLRMLITSDAELLDYARRVAEENLNYLRVALFEQGELYADHQAAYKAGACQAFTRLTSASADAIVGSELIKLYQAWDGRIVYRSGIPVAVYNAYPTLPTYDHVTHVATLSLTSAAADRHGFAISPVQANMVYASQDRLLVGNQRYQWFNYWRQLYVLPAVPGIAAECIGDTNLCAVVGAPRSGVVTVTTLPVVAINHTVNHFDFLTFNLTAEGARPSGLGTIPGTPVNNYAIDAGPNSLRFVVNQTQQNVAVVPGGVTQVIYNGAEVDYPEPYAYASPTKSVAMQVVRLEGTEWKVAATLPLEIGGSVAGARFFDKAAFISTNNSASPLYAVDLSNEFAPKMAGAMPDFMRATYFHRVDATTVLALGRLDARMIATISANCLDPVFCPQLATVSAKGVTMSMIDIANLAAPKVLARTTMQVGNSSAEYDFKSFRYIERLGLVVLPMTYPFRVELISAQKDKGFGHYGYVTLQDKFSSRYGMGGAPRTMLFDDLLVGVFGNQDFGAGLGYAARANKVVHSKDLLLTYSNQVMAGFPYYWILESGHSITPVWRSATLLQ